MEPLRRGWRQTSMRLVAVTVALVAALAACGNDGPSSSASCVGPYLNMPLRDRPGKSGPPPSTTVKAGGTLPIHGHWYTSTCNDTSGDNDPLVPLPDVILTVALPGGEQLHLGPFTPTGDDMGFEAQVTIPPDTPAGRATVSDNTGTVAKYAFDVVNAGS